MIDKFEGTQKKVLWNNKGMNVLIPMAGAGSRFSNAGYTFPKPLIEVDGRHCHNHAEILDVLSATVSVGDWKAWTSTDFI